MIIDYKIKYEYGNNPLRFYKDGVIDIVLLSNGDYLLNYYGIEYEIKDDNFH